MAERNDEKYKIGEMKRESKEQSKKEARNIKLEVLTGEKIKRAREKYIKRK